MNKVIIRLKHVAYHTLKEVSRKASKRHDYRYSGSTPFKMTLSLSLRKELLNCLHHFHVLRLRELSRASGNI